MFNSFYYLEVLFKAIFHKALNNIKKKSSRHLIKSE